MRKTTLEQEAERMLALLVQRGFSVEARLKVAKAGPKARFPERRWLLPVGYREQARLEDEFEISLEPEEDNGHRISIYSVAAFIGTRGKDYHFLVKANYRRTALIAFPLDWQILKPEEWQVDVFDAPELVFERKAPDKPWVAIEPKTGQLILALSRQTGQETNWEVEPSADDPQKSRPYFPGELAMRRAVTSSVLIAGPRQAVKGFKETSVARIEDGEESPNRFAHAELYDILGWWMTAWDLVGKPSDIGEAEEKQLIADLSHFKRRLLSEFHPDLVMNQLPEGPERARILTEHEARYKQLSPELDRAEAWLRDLFAYLREIQSVDRALYAAEGLTVPKLRLPERPKGKVFGKPLQGLPLTMRSTEEIFRVLRPQRKTRKQAPSAGRTAARPAAPTSARTARSDKPATTRKATAPVKRTEKVVFSTGKSGTGGSRKIGDQFPGLVDLAGRKTPGAKKRASKSKAKTTAKQSRRKADEEAPKRGRRKLKD